MRPVYFLCAGACAIAIAASAQAQPGSTTAAAPRTSQAAEQPSWFKASFLDLREDVAEAKAAGKRVLLYFYQDGCPYCAKLIRDNFGQKAIADRVQHNFDVVALNIWGDREVTDMSGHPQPEKAYARALRVQFTPTLVVLDEDGSVALRLNGYLPPHEFEAAIEYASRHLEHAQSLGAYMEGHTRARASGSLHDEPWMLPRPLRLADARTKTGKPLLVLFEQKECAACDELHDDAFARPEIKALLQRFNVALIEIGSRDPVQTPDGSTQTARTWAQALRLFYTPSLVFFDAMGQEVFRVEGYLRPFHLASTLEYVSSGAYAWQPEFQRFVEERAAARRALGESVDLMR